MIPKQDFLELLNQHPEMYFAIVKVLSVDLNTAERFLRKAPRTVSREKRSTNGVTSNQARNPLLIQPLAVTPQAEGQ